MGHLADREMYRASLFGDYKKTYDRKMRRTGKTTGQLLKTIGTALQIPETNIPIKDFEPYDPVLKGRQFIKYRYLIPMIKDLIKQLRLEGMIVHKVGTGPRKGEWYLRYEYRYENKRIREARQEFVDPSIDGSRQPAKPVY